MTKRANLDATLLSLTPGDRRAMERAANIMKIPLSHLLQATRPAGQVHEPEPLPPTTLDGAQRVVDLHADDEDDGGSLGYKESLGQGADIAPTDTPDNGQANDNDSRDSASEADITPWQSSGAEFRNIDDDIAREYETVPRWGEDFPVLSQATPPVQGAGSKTGPMPSAVRGQDALWDFPTPLNVSYVPHEALRTQQSPSTVGTLTAASASVPTPGYSSSEGGFVTPQQQQHQSWELVEMPQPPLPSQQAPPVTPRAYDWATSVGFGIPAQPSASSGLADVSSDAIRFIPVDPVQPQALSRPQKRGPFQDRERQEETSRTRGLKACVRCRMQKIRVSASNWCRLQTN